jgi:hypothetical protein
LENGRSGPLPAAHPASIRGGYCEHNATPGSTGG